MTHEQAVSALAAERYLLGEMSESERDAFEDHYFSCVLCAEEVRAGAIMQEGVHAGLAAETSGTRAVPFTASRSTWRMSYVLPWAAAASLAVVAGYQSLVTIPRARQGSEAMALSPVTLRPAARGNPVTVTIGPGITSVTLAVDIPTFDSSNLTYEIAGPANATVVAGAAPVPSSGSPLLLLIPARAVDVPGDYRLVVKASAGRAAQEEYLFKVRAP